MGKAVEVTRGDFTAAELRAASAKCSDGAQVRRILALALVLEGRSRTEAAVLNGMDRQTLSDWVHRFNAEGIEGLKSRRSPGREPSLTAAQKAKLRNLVIQGPDPALHKVLRWRCVDLREEVARRWSIEISTQVAEDAIAVLTCDGAGWHQLGGALVVPKNIVLLHLPPYNPELNPMEKIWDYLRQNKLCAVVWDSYDDIVQACKTAWNWLIADPARITSIGTRASACVSLEADWYDRSLSDGVLQEKTIFFCKTKATVSEGFTSESHLLRRPSGRRRFQPRLGRRNQHRAGRPGVQ